MRGGIEDQHRDTEQRQRGRGRQEKKKKTEHCLLHVLGDDLQG